MSRLSDIVSYRRSQGGSITGSLAGGIKERLKEKFDPRQLINQKGLMVSLFPGLKTYRAKASTSPRITGKSIEDSSVGLSEIKPSFEKIEFDSKVTAKNLSVLPAMHRDFNVMRQNIVKLLKMEKIDAATKADMYFKAAAKREEMYEAQLAKIRKDNNSPKKIVSGPSSGSMLDILVFGSILGLTIIAIKQVNQAIEKIRNIDLKDALDDFTRYVSDSLDKVLDSMGIGNNEIDESEIEKELSKITFGSLTEEQKIKFLDAQFESEGNKAGNTARELNNPGAMVFRDWHRKYGGEPGKTITGPDGKVRTFTKFPSLEEGKKAQREHWENQYGNKPLNEALRKWVAPHDEKQFKNYMKRAAKSIGITVKQKKPDNVKTEIKDAEVAGLKMKQVTGNFGTYGQMGSVNNIILHHTGGDTLSSALGEMQRNQKGGYKHGSQFIIDRDGTIFNLAPETSVMYHAGTKTDKNGPTNWNSIGIEIVSKDSSSFTEAQKKSAKTLVQALRKKYGNLNVFGHGELRKYGADKMPSEGKKLAEEIRKESDEGLELKPISLGNPSLIEDASFQVSMGNLGEEVPIVLINTNNIIQQNPAPVASQSREKDPLDMLSVYLV